MSRSMSHSPMPPVEIVALVNKNSRNLIGIRYVLHIPRLPVSSQFWFDSIGVKLLVFRKTNESPFFTCLFPEHNGREYSFLRELSRNRSKLSSHSPKQTYKLRNLILYKDEADTQKMQKNERSREERTD